MDPFTMLSLIQGAQQVVGFVQASANAEYQQEWQDRTEGLTRQAAIQEATANYTQTRRRESEAKLALASEVRRVTREATKRAGTARVTAAESGVSGGSVAAVVRQFAGRAAEFSAVAQLQRQMLEAQTAAQLKAIEDQAYNRIVAGQQPEIQKPTIQGLLLGIGTGIGQARMATLN